MLANSKYDSVAALQRLNISYDDATALRRISMTLHRWHEMECGIDGGCIERGIKSKDTLAPRGYVFNCDENGKPYWANHSGTHATYHPIPDREAGALKRLASIMSRYPTLSSYVQTDPRGAALYILRPGDVPEGERAESYYSRGVVVCK